MKILFLVSTGINILLGLYLFGDKIIDPEDFDPFLAFWLMIALVVAFGVVDFSLYVFGLISRFACEDRTIAMESENSIEMKQYGSAGGHDAPKPKKDPSQVSWSSQHNIQLASYIANYTHYHYFHVSCPLFRGLTVHQKVPAYDACTLTIVPDNICDLLCSSYCNTLVSSIIIDFSN